MSLELGSLKDRVELPNGELIPWESPGGKPMKIAATAPEYPWSDIAQALEPNGSDLDYVANAPYAACSATTNSESKRTTGTPRCTRGPAARLLRADLRRRPRSEHHRMAQLRHHRRPLQRQTARGAAGRTAAQPQRLLHEPVRAALSIADGERLERRPVPRRPDSRSTTTRSARPTRTRRWSCSTSTSATTRVRRPRRRPATWPSSRPPRTNGSPITSGAKAANPPRPTAA